MRKAVADMVREFHTTFRLPAADTPRLPDTRLAALRVRLLLEEAREVEEAAEHRNLAGVAQELADVVYVAYGTALTYGIDLDAVVAEIHRANMSKLDADGKPILREDGKVLKSDLYRAPDVAAVLAEQRRTGGEWQPADDNNGNEGDHA